MPCTVQKFTDRVVKAQKSRKLISLWLAESAPFKAACDPDVQISMPRLKPPMESVPVTIKPFDHPESSRRHAIARRNVSDTCGHTTNPEGAVWRTTVP